MGWKIKDKTKLGITIGISFVFFIAEIIVAFKTGSLALMADAFHYLNDLISFVVALTAVIISERSKSPQDLSFGWQRARLLGAFFNGAFLLALGISILLQSVERFVSIQEVENPKLVLIMGCVGLGLNLVSAAFLHEHHGHHDHNHEKHGHSHGHGHGHRHEHEIESGSDEATLVSGAHSHTEHRHHSNGGILKAGHGRDLGMLGALLHVLGDALNNLAVIVAAAIIWFTHSENRFYADPAVSLAIAIIILLSSIPLIKNAGVILLQSAPRGVDLADIRHDLEKIPGIESVHELHVWRLDQKKAIASAHVVVSDPDIANFMGKARTVSECLHAYGIHSATLQPELALPAAAMEAMNVETTATPGRTVGNDGAVDMSDDVMAASVARCQMICGKGRGMCGQLMCCTGGGVQI